RSMRRGGPLTFVALFAHPLQSVSRHHARGPVVALPLGRACTPEARMHSRMSARSAPIALVAVGALVATTVGVAPALASTPATVSPQPAVATDVPERAADKISPAVQQRFEAKRSSDFWIQFADTPDLAPAKDIADWAERGQFVYDALTSTAKESQAGVVAD